MLKKIPVLDISANPEPQDLYASSAKIQTRRIRGYFQRLRRIINAPLMLAFFLLPWLSIDARPAILLDIAERRFYVLWATFWPQDGILLAWVLIIAAFLLFTATVWAGRIWCGFSCPQTVWTLIFIWIEDLCEGDRNQRIKLDQQPLTLNKCVRRGTKHALWLFVSVATSITFVSYFYGSQALLKDLVTIEVSLQTWFWLALFTGFTYMNAGWLREQVCQFMCPYSRIQAAMYDSDSLLVSYDAQRGQHQQKTGDCVNCDWCVQVCPVGIDIRDGLQTECINCGLCIDACDKVMEKIHKPKGLIRFASERELSTHGQGVVMVSPDDIAQPPSTTKKPQGRLSNLFRPRLVGYSLVLFIAVGYFTYSVSSRAPLTMVAMRDRGINLYHHRGENIENVYRLQLANKSGERQQYRISVSGALSYQLKGHRRIILEKGEVFTVPLRVKVPFSQLKDSHNTLEFIAQYADSPSILATTTASFIGPR